MTYLLSIVIPTKDRYYYLKQLIELIRSYNTDDIELIIQDNTLENKEIVDYINSLNYKNLKYFHTNEQLAVSDNCSKAVQNSTGKYVCVIGDDDGVLPSIVNVVKDMDRGNYDALVPKYTIYNWPDYVDNSIYKTSSTILYNKGDKSLKEVNPREEFTKAKQSGFRNMALMPRIYQAIVKRSILNEVFDKCGSFFPGPSPDMSNAVALSCLENAPRTVYYDAIVVISGQCKSVGGGERIMKKNQLKLIDEVPFLPKNVKEIWDNRLPKYWCSDTVWPASATCAFNQMTGETISFDQNLVIARFIYNHPTYYKECIGMAPSKPRVWIVSLRFTVGRIIMKARNLICYLISRKKKDANYSYARNVNNISEAVRFLIEQ